MRTPSKISTAMCVSVCVGLAVALAACSSDKKALEATTTTTVVPVATTSSLVDVSTTLEATTTTAAPTTSTEAPTTTTEAPTTTIEATTTTAPPGASLSLRPDGIGDARFGTEPDDVVTYMTAVLGAAAEDTGWVDAITRTCPGTEVRFVTWGDLTLQFGDESNVSIGRRHFYAWSFGPPAGTEIQPAGLLSPEGIGIGSTVAQVATAFPEAQVYDGDDTVTPSVQIEDGLFAFLTDSTPAGAITIMHGGQGCEA